MSGCAVGKDGNLLDESEIQFFHDVDDEAPISGPSTSSLDSRPLHPLFKGPTSNHAPAPIVAGSRRTARVSRPSTKARDPNNAVLTTATTSAKRKSSGRHVLRKIVSDSESDTGHNSESRDTTAMSEQGDDCGLAATGDETDGEYPPLVDHDDEEDEEESPAVAYSRTKELGDIDRAVSVNPMLQCQ
jgi:hypothetical protein